MQLFLLPFPQTAGTDEFFKVGVSAVQIDRVTKSNGNTSIRSGPDQEKLGREIRSLVVRHCKTAAASRGHPDETDSLIKALIIAYAIAEFLSLSRKCLAPRAPLRAIRRGQHQRLDLQFQRHTAGGANERKLHYHGRQDHSHRLSSVGYRATRATQTVGDYWLAQDRSTPGVSPNSAYGASGVVCSRTVSERVRCV